MDDIRTTLYQNADELCLNFNAGDNAWRADLGGSVDRPTIEFKPKGSTPFSYSLDIKTGVLSLRADAVHMHLSTALAMAHRTALNVVTALAAIGYTETPLTDAAVRLQIVAGEPMFAVNIAPRDKPWSAYAAKFALNDEDEP